MRRAAFIGVLVLSLGATAQQPTLDQQAAALEKAGKGPDAVRLYIQAARGGSRNAAARLAEIYDKGIEGVDRSRDESLKWANVARNLGARHPLIGDFPTVKERERDRAAPQR